jgi:hypothetical protein
MNKKTEEKIINLSDADADGNWLAQGLKSGILE